MACGATLKRSHEFDSLHSPGRSPKRICGELISSPKPQCPNYSHPASFVEAAHKLANGRQVSLSASPNRAASHSAASSQQSSITASVSAGRLSALVDDSSRLIPAPSHTASLSASSTSLSRDQPVLSLAQVDLICQRIIQEHDVRVREHFDQVLNNKLAEQYELFLKFNHDQLRRKFGADMCDCSYVS